MLIKKPLYVKVNTIHIPPSMTTTTTSESASEDVTAAMATAASTTVTSRPEDIEDLSGDQPYEMIELPITVTKGNVKMMWKILCAAPNTIGFVAYRPSASASASSASSASESLATYIQSGIALHPNDYSEIEVKAQRSGFYVLQLRSTRYVSSMFPSWSFGAG